MAHDVFISYASEDKPVADAMCATLESSGIRCWVAPRDVLPGKGYAEAIIDGISASRIFVLLLSSKSNASPHVMREVERAVNKAIPIIPFRIEDVPLSRALEYFVSSQHWLDALTPPLQAHLRRLAATVQMLLSAATTASEPAVPGAITAPEAALTFGAAIKSPDLLSGHVLGAYILREPIGTGGTGLAYRAWNSTLGQKACIKVFYPVGEEAHAIEATVARGVRALAALNHPHLARIFDFGKVRLADGSSFYVAMEFIEGQTLDKWNEQPPDNRKPLAARLRMAFGLTMALAAAHNCRYIDEVGFEHTGVLHGDIKPANIIVRPDDSPVLLDFMMVDVQRLLDPKVVPRKVEESECLTGAFGTLGFMAPEQERDGIVTARSDIFSLGVTFCHLFFRGNVGEASAPHGDRLDDLRRLLRDMLEANPARRPQNAREVAERLSQIAVAENIPLPALETEGKAAGGAHAKEHPRGGSSWRRFLPPWRPDRGDR